MPNKKTAQKLIDDNLKYLDPEGLESESYKVIKDGYLKGTVVAVQQLKPLNVAIEANLGNKASIETLRKLRDKNQKYVKSWENKINQKIYDIVYDGLENGLTKKQISEEIMKVSGKDILESIRAANDIVIDAARRGEIDLLRQANISIYRDIAVVDNRTCEVCLGLNGQIYREAYDERGMSNYDTGEFLKDDLADLVSQAGLEDFIDPEMSMMDGPPYHGYCRCHMAPVLTFEQYKGAVSTTISEVE